MTYKPDGTNFFTKVKEREAAMTARKEPEHTGYWLTPESDYKKLNDEFHFDYDPCPYPRPEGFDGLKTDWGKTTFVNPPFHKVGGKGPTAFMRKAIEENKKGKTVVLIAPTQSYVNLMLEAGAELRSMGRIRWLHGETKEPCKDPSPITAFILRSRPHPAPERDFVDTPEKPWCYPGCMLVERARKEEREQMAITIRPAKGVCCPEPPCDNCEWMEKRLAKERERLLYEFENDFMVVVEARWKKECRLFNVSDIRNMLVESLRQREE